MYQEIETAIVQRLLPLEVSLAAKIMPFDAIELSQPQHDRTVFVGYNSSVFSRPLYFEGMVQQETLNIEVLIAILDIRTHGTAYPLIEAVKQSLIGFKPIEVAVSELYLVTQKFDRITPNGIWTYTQMFRMAIESRQSENFV